MLYIISYNISEEQINCFNENIKYIIEQTEKNLNNINTLKNEIYFEMSRNQIICYFKELLSTTKNWQAYFNNHNIYKIQKEYKQLESNVSELELCLADYDGIFHCEGISYALYEIGKILIEILNDKNEKENDQDVR